MRNKGNSCLAAFSFSLTIACVFFMKYLESVASFGKSVLYPSVCTGVTTFIFKRIFQNIPNKLILQLLLYKNSLLPIFLKLNFFK